MTGACKGLYLSDTAQPTTSSALQLFATQLCIASAVLCCSCFHTAAYRMQLANAAVVYNRALDNMQLSSNAVLLCAAAPHSKSGVTVDSKLADRNQHGTLPHLRLMEWVWSYFVDSSADSDTHHDAGHESSTRAGAVHAQPSKQASGSSYWEGQEDDKMRQQQRTDGQQTAPSSSIEVISKTGRFIFLLTK